MTGYVEVGHAIITCPRCGECRHVPIEAVCRPVAGPDTKAWRAVLNGDTVGQIHLAVRHRPDGHRCRPGSTPQQGLRLVRGEDTCFDSPHTEGASS